jgi:predicted lipoprotein with Yx(FWY)xxD motif
VDTRTGPLGTYLVDSSGRTLYYFAADTHDRSNCYGVCAAGWPMLTVSGTPTVGPGVDVAKLGTITRADKTTQVTYDGLPLYRFVLDAKPGDIFGQDLPAFGGPWWMVDPTSGRPITKTPPALPPAKPPAAPATVTIAARRGSLGTYLTSGSGTTVYRFDGDGPNTSRCTGLCAEVWPPVLVKGGATAGSGITPGRLGTTRRPDGTRQVTYDRMPLYTFALDGGKAGVTNGQGQRVAGNTWWVISPDGRTIDTPIPANGPAAPRSATGGGGSGGTHY